MREPIMTDTIEKPSSIAERIENHLVTEGYHIRYNSLLHQVYVGNEPISDMIESEIRLKMKEYGHKPDDIRDAINVIAKSNTYHPLKDYFTSLPVASGTDTLSALWNCLEVEGDRELLYNVFVKFLVGTVAKVMERAQNLTIILEGKGGIGKTSLCKWLSINDEWYTAQKPNPTHKDSAVLISQKFIWELEELENVTSKVASGALKAFLTTEQIDYRTPHAKHSALRYATASFIGTVNGREYLIDTTGNRRFFAFEVTHIDYSYQDIDKDTLWSEIYTLYHNGYDIRLSPEEKEYQSKSNEEKMHYEAVYDYIVDIVEPGTDDEFVSAKELQDSLREKGINVERNSRKIKEYMQKLGYKDSRSYVNGKQVRGYSGCKLIGSLAEDCHWT